MTYNEITLFRRFMTNKGVLNNFEYLFSHHRLESKTIDEYYEDASADLVIMTAFDFDRNSFSGIGYSGLFGKNRRSRFNRDTKYNIAAVA